MRCLWVTSCWKTASKTSRVAESRMDRVGYIMLDVLQSESRSVRLWLLESTNHINHWASTAPRAWNVWLVAFDLLFLMSSGWLALVKSSQQQIKAGFITKLQGKMFEMNGWLVVSVQVPLLMNPMEKFWLSKTEIRSVQSHPRLLSGRNYSTILLGWCKMVSF